MNLMHWRTRPSSPLFNLQQEINRMFEDFGHFGQRDNDESPITPALDIKEDEEYLTVTADLPGVDGKDVEINVDDDVLTIKGEKRSERHEKKDTYRCVERMFGSFERRVTLPTEVDSERAEASMENGVLTLRLPKTESRKARSIPIRGSQQGQREMSMSGNGQGSMSGGSMSTGSMSGSSMSDQQSSTEGEESKYGDQSINESMIGNQPRTAGESAQGSSRRK